jgi:hypothetical protein
MESCCKETYKNTLKEILIFVDKKKITDINILLNTIAYAFSMLDEEE